MRTVAVVLFAALVGLVLAESPAAAPKAPAPVYSSPSSSSQKCATTTVNIRSSASTSGRIVGSLTRGSSVSVSSTSNGWSQIGSGRYVSAQYLGSCGSAPVYSPPAPVYSPPAPVYSSSGSGISVDQLRAIMTGLSSSNANKYIGALNNAMSSASINSCARRSAFIAQLAHESGQLRYWEEIASGSKYEGRKDLGNTQPGDGKRFKGRGPIQLTGRANYAAAGRALGMDLISNPSIVSTVDVGFKTTLWFWNSKNLSSYADQNTQSSFDTITRRINGGTNGKADRDQFWRRAKSVLGC